MEKLIDPIEFAEKIEAGIMDGDKRPYRSFEVEPFYGQMVTGRSVGCNIGCNFCWTDYFPKRLRELPVYSPQEAYNAFREAASNQYGPWIQTEYLRVSGCEPTIGMSHLIGLLRLIEENQNPSHGMLIETNGMLLGKDEDIAREIARFRNKLVIRLSIKAGTTEGLEKRAKVKGEFLDLPFRALEYLEKHNIPYIIATASGDSRLMPAEERRELLKRLVETSNQDPMRTLSNLAEEVMDLFGRTRDRLKKAGVVDPEMLAGQRFLYEHVFNSLERILIPEGTSQKPNRIFTKVEILKALDEAEFRVINSQIPPMERYDDNPPNENSED